MAEMKFFAVRNPKERWLMAALECHLLLLTQTAHFTAPDFFDRIIEVLDNVEAVEQGLGLRFGFLLQVGVGLPHIHADDLERVAAPAPHFLGEERPYCFLG